jgi:hypothetical protein
MIAFDLPREKVFGAHFKEFESSGPHLNRMIRRATLTADGQFETQNEGLF